MSAVLTGSASNVTTPLVASVVSLANNGSGAIRVQTSLPHLFGNGDTAAMICGPSLQGQFVITVIDSTHFDLVGSTFTSTATGSATDLSLTPQIQCPSDGDAFSAQLSGLLSAYQGTLDRTQFLQLQAFAQKASVTSIMAGALVSLGAAQSFGQNGPYQLVYHDQSQTQQWVATSFNSGGSPQVALYYGGADGTWTQIGSPAGTNHTPSSACVDSSGNIWVTVYDGSVTQVHSWVAAGLSGSLSSNPVTTVGFTPSDFQVAAIGTTIVAAVGAASGANAALGTTSTGASFTSVLGSITAQSWILRSNGMKVLAVPANVASTGVAAYVTTNGVSWTSATIGIGVGESAIDAQWDAARSQWVLITESSTSIFVYTSSDGQTWSQVAKRTPATFWPPTSLSIVTGVYVLALTVGIGSNTSQLAVSVDGGATWHVTPERMYGSGAAPSGRIYASPNQIIFWMPPVRDSATVESVRTGNLVGPGDTTL